MGLLALILAIIGAIVVLLSFVGSLGFFMWIGGIIALAGVVFGFMGRTGDQKTLSVVGLVVSIVFFILALLRIVGLF